MRAPVLRNHKLLLSLGTFAVLLAVPLVRAVAGLTQDRPASFPPITSYALDKQKIALPEGLEGDSNLLLLSFAPNQANQLESWTAVSQALEHTNIGFRAYRVPVAEKENAIFRWWENASLRSAETDPELWHWVVPIYVDKQPLRAQLGIADEKSVVALLVNKNGQLLWRATGASTAESRASLIAAANAVR